LPLSIKGIADEYKDMKGIGLWDFSDETVRFTQEMAIMLASMVVTALVTAGIGTVLA